MPNYRVSGNDLTSVADAIRTKGGTSASLSFPDGFVSAVQNIPTGGGSTLITKSITENGTYSAQDDDADGYSQVTVSVGNAIISGSFTVPSNAFEYTLNFGSTISRYIYYVEMTEESKEELMETALNANKTFAFDGVYPLPEISESSFDNQYVFGFRVNPSTSILSGATAYDCLPKVASTTSMTFQAGGYSYGANVVYQGLTYKYWIVEIN